MSAPVGNEDQQVEVETPEVAPVETTENPAWNPVWESIEKEPTLAPFVPRLKETLSPHFSKWDADRQSVTQQYAPFKQYVDQGIKPELIEGSLRLYQLMDRNPRFIFDQLREHYGFTVEQAQAVADAAQDQQDNAPADSDEDVDPSFAALQQQIQTLADARAHDEQERVEVQMKNDLDANIKSVLAAHAASPVAYLPLTDRMLTSRISQELAVAEMTGQPYRYNVQQTYKNWVDEVNQYRAIPAPNQAPQLTPAGGSGLPVHTGGDSIPVEAIKGTKAQRLAWIEQRFSGRS